MYSDFRQIVQPKNLNTQEETMETSINMLPEMSEKFDIVLMQLMKAKNQMGTAVKKDAANPFHKSRYATLGAHLELSESVLAEHGLIMLQTVNGTHDKAILIATLCHPGSGQWIRSYMPLPNPKGDSQGLGASITYMRRYSINTMLGLNAEDDDGETAAGRGKYEKEKAKSTPAPAAPQLQTVGHAQTSGKLNGQQINTLRTLEAKLDVPSKNRLYARMKEVYNADKFEDLVADGFQKVLSGFENAVKFSEDQQKQSKIQILEVARA